MSGAARPGTAAPRVATAALALGLCSVPLAYLLVGGVLGVVAVLLGIVGVRRADAIGGAGKGRSITGLVSGVVAIIVAARLVAALTLPVEMGEPDEVAPATETGGI